MDTRRHPTEHRWTRRLGVLMLAVLQMAAATVLPAADGVLDVDRYSAPVHVESEGRDDCSPHHDHVFCQVVRSTALANPSRSATEVVALVSPPAIPAVRAAEAPRAGFETRQASASPRAPPSA